MSNIFTLDIETKPDESLIEIFKSNIKPSGTLKDPKKIEADIAKKQENYRKSMSVDQDYCDILCIGIKPWNEPSMLYNIEDMDKWFSEEFTNDSTLVTFNGKSFDIPIIIKAGVKHKLDLPYDMLKKMTERFRAYNHVDLMHLLSFGDNRNVKNLDTYLKIYLGKGKNTVGEDFFATATENEIRQHCLDDLVDTENLFKQFRFLS